MSQIDLVGLSTGTSVIAFYILLILYGGESMKNDIRKSRNTPKKLVSTAVLDWC